MRKSKYRRITADWQPPILSRQAAIESNSVRYFTGEPCVNGHVAQRYTTNGGCLECVRPVRFGPTRADRKPSLPAQPFQVPLNWDAAYLATFYAWVQTQIDKMVQP
jgi:hypothetical protein